MGAETGQAILITGAAGFIGSHLVERLRQRGERLTCLDNFDPYYPSGLKQANLKEALDGCDPCFVQGDIRDGELLRRLFSEREIGTVVHLAARPGVRASLRDPAPCLDINVQGTLSLLEACRSFGVRRFIFASSSSIYGESAGVPVSEDGAAHRPLSPYGASKAAAELLCHSYARLFDMTTIVLRFFTVYGPRQRPDMAIRRFTELIDRGREVRLFGDGQSRRDYTYIADIIAGIEASLSEPLVGFHVFNLGGSHPVPLATVIELIERNLGKQAEVRFEPPQPGEPTVTFADISKAASILGFHPSVPVEEGIRRFVGWYRERRDALAEITDNA